MLSRSTHGKNVYNLAKAIGDRVISSDAVFVIDGLEAYYQLFTNFPMPYESSGEPVEIPLPSGYKKWQKSQGEKHQQGGITIGETVAGDAANLMKELLSRGGEFNAKIYEGNPEEHLKYYQLYGCIIKLDVGERALESTTEPTTLTGNLHYHYFGEIIEGDKAKAKAELFLGLGR